MKPRFALFVLALFLCGAIVSSLGSYHHAERLIVSDMDQALVQTLSRKQDLWLTPDTIRDYRSHLHLPLLRGQSFIGYDMPYGGLRSNARIHRSGDSQAVFRSYASCSPLTVFLMADHRLPALLWLSVLLWGSATVGIMRRRQLLQQVGSLCYDREHDLFLDNQQQPIRLTPMQQQLMQMFFQAEDNLLPKQTICDTLWPKKPDASETLYTLVRRLKPIIERNSNLEIVSDRGKSYKLTVRNTGE